jgi:hypothetical protein
MKAHGLRFALCMWAVVPATLLAQSGEGTGGAESAFLRHPPALQEREQSVRAYLRAHPEAKTAARLAKTNWSFVVGSTKTWYADDLTTSSTRYQVATTCRAVGTHCYVFVEDASWTGGRVTQANVDSIRVTFDDHTPANGAKGIYQSDVDAFGNPPDVDADPRIIIFVLDIKDGYTPGSGFVVGYFYSYNELGLPQSNNAEVFYLDCNPLNMATPSHLREGMATLAHEFQHMIHYNYDSNEDTFIDESCALVAEVNCGYPLYSPDRFAGESNIYLFNWRGNDLNLVLNDYSRAARFSLYYRDQLGMPIFKSIVSNTQNGIAGINGGLASAGTTTRRFNDLFVDWEIANVLDDQSVDPRYGYVYPGLPKLVGRNLGPSASITTDTVQHLGVRCLTFTGGNALTANFTASNGALLFKAVEIGPSSKRVLDITPGVQFSEPAFGSTYKTINVLVMNTNTGTPFTYTYQASSTPTEVEGAPQSLPLETSLSQNYPNPFNPTTAISYQLSAASKIRLAVYDMLGREVGILVDEFRAPGRYTTAWDARGFASGLYVCRLSVGTSYTEARKMVLVR